MKKKEKTGNSKKKARERKIIKFGLERQRTKRE